MNFNKTEACVTGLRKHVYLYRRLCATCIYVNNDVSISFKNVVLLLIGSLQSENTIYADPDPEQIRIRIWINILNGPITLVGMTHTDIIQIS